MEKSRFFTIISINEMIYYDFLLRVEQQYVQFYGRKFTISSIQAVLIQYGQYKSSDIFGTLSLYSYDFKKRLPRVFEFTTSILHTYYLHSRSQYLVTRMLPICITRIIFRL